MKTIFPFLLVLSPNIFCSDAWHADDQTKAGKKTVTECALEIPIARGRTVSNATYFHKIKLWPGLLPPTDQVEFVAGFPEAINYVQGHQNPKDCSKAKFLLTPYFNWGFGSEIHMYSVALAVAINMNRVLIMDRNNITGIVRKHSKNAYQVNNTFCRDQQKEDLDCYYEPFSKCSFADVIDMDTYREKFANHKHSNPLRLRQDHLADLFNSSSGMKRLAWEELQHSKVVLLDHSTKGNLIIPINFIPFLDCSPIAKTKYHYWWRAVSTAYMLRPTPAVRDQLKSLREQTLQAFNRTNNDNRVDNCVSVYIRRGDKEVENKGQPLVANISDYFETAKSLKANMKLSDSSGGVMFVGSEDYKAIDAAKSWGQANNWTIMHTELFDRRMVDTNLNYSQQVSLRKSGRAAHHEMEYLGMLLDLDFHSRCHAFVCTQKSNFCQIIDELRATVGGKAGAQLADLSCGLVGESSICINNLNISLAW